MWLKFRLFIYVLLTLLLASKVLATTSEGQDEDPPDEQTLDMQPWRPDKRVGEFLALYNLPNKLIDQHPSRDRQFVAQLMYAEPGPVYFLVIIDRKLGHRFYLDKRLIIGKDYPFQKMRVYWQNDDVIVIRARHGDGSHFLFIHYNKKTGELTQGKEIIPPGPAPRDKLAPGELKPIVLKTLDNRMLLHRQIPIGVTYPALKNALPQLGNQKGSASGLSKAYFSIELLGRSGQIEFNFKNSVLYNFYYHLAFENLEQASKAYSELQDYYSGHYGKFGEDKLRESENYAVETSFWKTDEVDVSVVNNISSSGNRIIWGLKQ